MRTGREGTSGDGESQRGRAPEGGKVTAAPQYAVKRDDGVTDHPGVPGPERDKQRDMRVWEMYYEEHMTLRAIGELMGISTEWVRQLRNRHGKTAHGILMDLYRERDILDNSIGVLKERIAAVDVLAADTEYLGEKRGH